MKPSEIATRLGIGRTTVYRVVRSIADGERWKAA